MEESTGLESKNRFERKEALVEIHSKLTSTKLDPNLDSKLDLEEDLWHQNHLILFRILKQDESERCREMSAKCILECYSNKPRSYHSQYFLPIARERLVEGLEGSEEVRVLVADSLLRMLDGDELKDPDFEDVCEIVAACLGDNCPRVKLSGAEATLKLHENGWLKQDGAETMAGAAQKNLTHQRRKVRKTSVEALGACLLQCTSATFRGCMPSLAQRLFDPAPEVRTATAKVAADLLTEWAYRYDNFAYLVPLLITGLEDELEEVSSKVWELWEFAGQKWVEEEAKRDKRVKDMLDFPSEKEYNLPQGVKIVSLGCHLLTSRIFYRLKEAISRDLTDWLPETRVKAAQLLYLLLVHLEDDLVGHCEEVLDIFNRAVMDGEARVVEYVCRSAVLFGCFVPPKTWLALMFQRLKEKVGSNDLKILSHLILGVGDPCLLRPHLDDIAFCLQDESVCQLRQDEYQSQLVSCASQLLAKGGQHCSQSCQEGIFTVAITARALAQSRQVTEQAQDLLGAMITDLGYVDKQDLFKHHMGAVLKRHLKKCPDWGAHTHQAAIFATLIKDGGRASIWFSDQILQVFENVLSNNSSPPELKIRIIMSLARTMVMTAEGQTFQANAHAGFGHTLKIIDLLVPHLKYKAGKKHLAVRMAAAAAILSTIDYNLDLGNVKQVAAELHKPLYKLMEDSKEKIRAYAIRCCRSIMRLSQVDPTLVPQETIIHFGRGLIKKLDDTSDEIRLLSIDAVRSLNPKVLNTGADNVTKGFLKDLYEKLLLHMDDKEERIRFATLDALKMLSNHDKSLLSEILSFSGGAQKYLHEKEIKELEDFLREP